MEFPDFPLAWEKAGQLFWEWLRHDPTLRGAGILDAIDQLYTR